MAFPTAPSNGQVYKEFIYNATIGAWESYNDELIQDNADDISGLDLNVDASDDLGGAESSDLKLPRFS